MVDYIEAIKKPFTDLKKSGLAVLFGLFGMIIFIPYLFNFGYFLECAKNSSKKELPEWGNYWEKFVRGFFLFLIFFIYAIPLLILLVFLLIKFTTGLIGSGERYVETIATGNPVLILNFMTKLFSDLDVRYLVIIGILLGVLILYLIPMAMLFYITNWQFKDAFELKSIFRKAFTKKYLSAWLVANIYTSLLGGISTLFGFIPFFGGIVAIILSVLGGITSYTIYGNIYKEIKV